MGTALDEVIGLLDLEPIEVNIFRGRSPQENRQRVFGGQVLGQALVAAQRTVEEPERVAHSFHGYFLRPGDPTVPILYEVDRIRDGRSFTTRRVVAIQHGRAIFNMSVSFQIIESGLEYQQAMPDVPGPESLPSHADYIDSIRADAPADAAVWLDRERPIDVRYVDPVNPFAPEAVDPPLQRVWFRTNGSLPDDLELQQAMVAYAVDMWLLDCSTMPHGVSFHDPKMQMASLDHAMWFHRPFRADEWLLLVAEATSVSNARGFNRSSIYTATGELVSSATQEGLVRRHD